MNNRQRMSGKISFFQVILILLVIAAFLAIYFRFIKPPAGPAVASDAGRAAVSGGQLNRPIRVGIVTWGGYAGGIMSNNGFAANKNCDFYRNYGIQVDLKVIDDFVESRSAFKAGGDKGGLDIVWGTVDAYALEYGALKILNPKCIMQYDWSRGGDAIAVDSRVIRTAKDLKGKSIACAEDTPSHYFALYVLGEAGLKPADVKWNFVNSAVDAANVFKAGKTDACVSWSPDVYIAARERPNGKILMSTREATNLIADIFIARGDFLEKHPDAAEKFIKGWLEGVDKVHRNPDPVIPLMAKGFNLPEADSKAMLGDVHLPNYADNVFFFDSNRNVVSYDAIFTKASNLWKDMGKIAETSSAKETRQTLFLFNTADNFRDSKEVDPVRLGQATAGRTAGETLLEKQVTINFPTGSSTLDAESQSLIRKEVASMVATYGGCFVSIEGNTDNTGSYAVNKTLSQQRAESVMGYLVQEFSLPSSRFTVKGNAWDKTWDSRPVEESNATVDGRAKNRRTDIVIKGSK
jgi:NitT/TauT family transport system substrate-binding protein